MPSYSSLTPTQKIQYAKDVAMANNGVTQPNITAINTANLDKLIAETATDLNDIRQLIGSIQLTSGSNPYTYPIPFSALPPDVQAEFNKFIPPGYTPPATVTGQEIIDITQGVLNSLQELKSTPATLPKAGVGTTPAVQPTTTTTTIIPAIKNTVTTPITPTNPAVTTINRTTPQSTSSPSNTGPTTTDIIKAAILVEGSVALYGALANSPTPQVQQTTPATLTIPEPAQALSIPTPIVPATPYNVVIVPNNNNVLQEPPVLSDDEIDSYIRQAGQDETITSPDSITENVFNPSVNNDPFIEEDAPTGNQGAPRGLSTPLADTRGKATAQDVANFQAKPDWRVRLSLAPGATYLYKAATPGILAPLAATDGVIFPYTPSISVQYASNYDATELTHSNYKFFTYRGSAVDSVNITCDFTAQDTFEANYLLAVIHFFRSVTKMFYGQDQNPKIGTPPPLCYLSGLGAFQFDAHPLAVTGFNYALPTDVDYIRTGSTPTPAGVSKAPANTPINSFSVSGSRANANGVNPGGGVAPPQFTPPAGSRDVTYVPTKMSISISAVPIVTRNDISNKFSLTEYATGKLLRGTQRQGGGIW